MPEAALEPVLVPVRARAAVMLRLPEAQHVLVGRRLMPEGLHRKWEQEEWAWVLESQQHLKLKPQLSQQGLELQLGPVMDLGRVQILQALMRELRRAQALKLRLAQELELLAVMLERQLPWGQELLPQLVGELLLAPVQELPLAPVQQPELLELPFLQEQMQARMLGLPPAPVQQLQLLELPEQRP